MRQANYQQMLDTMCLISGHVFSIPITLPVDPGPAIRSNQQVALRDAKYDLLAIMTIDELYDWDYAEVAHKVFGTLDLRHPLVSEMRGWGKLNIFGQLQVLRLKKMRT